MNAPRTSSRNRRPDRQQIVLVVFVLALCMVGAQSHLDRLERIAFTLILGAGGIFLLVNRARGKKQPLNWFAIAFFAGPFLIDVFAGATITESSLIVLWLALGFVVWLYSGQRTREMRQEAAAAEAQAPTEAPEI